MAKAKSNGRKRPDLSHIEQALRKLAEPIENVTADPANARTHSPRNLEVVTGSLKAFGQQKPIVVDGDGICRAGNATLEAARSLGWKTIAVSRTELKGQEAAAYAIADNRSGDPDIGSAWDDETLRKQLAEIEIPDFDVGFTDLDLKQLDARIGHEVEQDEVPEVAESPIGRVRDVWKCGEHRVVCGDATRPESWKGCEAGLCVTDPPYGVALDQGWRDCIPGVNRMGAAQSDRIEGDTGMAWMECFPLIPAGVIYVWHAAVFAPVVFAAVAESGFEIRQQIVWKKTMAPMGRSAYHWGHEPCWYAVKKGGKAKWTGGRTETTVWEAASPKHIMGGSDEDKEDHPTQKPVEVMARPMRNHAFDAVCDPFLGSGTTLIAAHQLDRRCYGIEIEPRYVDVSLKRWMKLTGDSPVRESDGARFADLAGVE